MKRLIVSLLLFFILSVNLFAAEDTLAAPQGLGYKNGFKDIFTDMQFKRISSNKFLGVYEVTQAQWEKVMGENPSFFKNGDNYPVETISINDINKFLKRFNEETKSIYRLPTVAEWRLALGEVEFKDIDCSLANIYDISSNNVNHFGNKYFECDDTYPNTSPVGSFSANEKGFYDMLGNVREWCCNSTADITNTCAPSAFAATLATVGGSFSDGPRDGKRIFEDNRPITKSSSLGFRLLIEEKNINRNSIIGDLHDGTHLMKETDNLPRNTVETSPNTSSNSKKELIKERELEKSAPKKNYMFFPR